jgi:hypothetical protein
MSHFSLRNVLVTLLAFGLAGTVALLGFLAPFDPAFTALRTGLITLATLLLAFGTFFLLMGCTKSYFAAFAGFVGSAIFLLMRFLAPSTFSGAALFTFFLMFGASIFGALSVFAILKVATSTSSGNYSFEAEARKEDPAFAASK